MIFEKQIKAIFASKLLVRYDDGGTVRYFSADDFRGLQKEPFEFLGNKGQKLCGAIYYYGEKSAERLIVFEHGMGGGHLSYMKEIETLAGRGYTVLSYDHTGCMMSEGENIGGFAQSLADLDFCIRALREREEYKNLSLSVVGHSWGAFSTLNIGAIHKDITHVVAMSGFVSVKAMLSQFFSGILSIYVPSLYKTECENAPEYAVYNAIESLAASSCKAMIIHSEDDKTVSFKKHFLKLKAAHEKREGTLFYSVKGKGHNPNFTADAVAYKDEFFADLTKKAESGYFTTDEIKAEYKASWDFERMTAQDENVWNDIVKFLEK